MMKYFGLCLADELLAGRGLEGLGHGGVRTPEQRGKEFGEVDEPLSCGADDAGEDLLGLRAAGRPIAATDFAIDDGRADGLLGTPVKCRAYCYAESRLSGPRWWSWCRHIAPHYGGAVRDAMSLSVALKRPERRVGGMTASRVSSFTDGSARV